MTRQLGLPPTSAFDRRNYSSPSSPKPFFTTAPAQHNERGQDNTRRRGPMGSANGARGPALESRGKPNGRLASALFGAPAVSLAIASPLASSPAERFSCLGDCGVCAPALPRPLSVGGGLEIGLSCERTTGTCISVHEKNRPRAGARPRPPERKTMPAPSRFPGEDGNRGAVGSVMAANGKKKSCSARTTLRVGIAHMLLRAAPWVPPKWGGGGSGPLLQSYGFTWKES